MGRCNSIEPGPDGVGLGLWIASGRGRFETGPYVRKGCEGRGIGYEGLVLGAGWFVVRLGPPKAPDRLTMNGWGPGRG